MMLLMVPMKGVSMATAVLARAVRGDASDGSDEGRQHGHGGPCKGLCVLSLWQFPHQQVVLAPLYECQDGPSAVFPDDGIHFPVSEPCPVGLRVSLVYHYPVLDGRIGGGTAPSDVLQPVPATLVAFASAATMSVHYCGAPVISIKNECSFNPAARCHPTQPLGKSVPSSWVRGDIFVGYDATQQLGGNRCIRRG